MERAANVKKFVGNVLLFYDIIRKYALPPFGRGRYNDVGQDRDNISFNHKDQKGRVRKNEV